MTWSEYVNNKRFPIDRKKYCDDDLTIIVDRILRYENLNRELAQVFASLEVPWTSFTSKAKSGFRKPNVPKIEMVSETEKQVILREFGAI